MTGFLGQISGTGGAAVPRQGGFAGQVLEEQQPWEWAHPLFTEKPSQLDASA